MTADAGEGLAARLAAGADEAARFAAEHAHYAPDLPLWRAVAGRLGGPVLDLGAATGRVAIPLAEDGHEVWAVDADHRMLAQLAQRAAAAGTEVAQRIRTVPADLRALSLGVRVPLAVAAMNTLQLLLEPEEQLRALRGVREHLAPGGEFWFDVVMPDAGEITASLGVVRSDGVHPDPESGGLLVRTAWYEGWDAVTQTAEYTVRIDAVAADGAMTTRLRMHRVHLFTPPELGHLLARAGLEPLQCWGGFAGEPLEDGALHQVYRCRAAA
jgi:SAM-dependent methyltransferase